ncbi:---NA---, partial [Paramuricea clavata]
TRYKQRDHSKRPIDRQRPLKTTTTRLIPHRNVLLSDVPTFYRNFLTSDAHNGRDGLLLSLWRTRSSYVRESSRQNVQSLWQKEPFCQGVQRQRTGKVNELEETTPHTVTAVLQAQAYSSDEELFCIKQLVSAGNKARVAIPLNGVPTRLLVDSGASVNILPMNVYNQIKQPSSKPKPTSICIYSY